MLLLTREMKRLSFFVLLISALFRLVRGTSSENKTSFITSQPRSMNVALNEEAVFNYGEMIFTDMGFEFTNELANGKSDVRTSMLTVTASLENNNTNITCVVAVFSTSTFSVSQPALLLIQGLLESVGDISMFLVNSTTALISWSPPFTLEGVAILGYNVTIANTMSEENETQFVGETTLLYSINGSNLDTNFTVVVVPINVVGAGQPAHQVFSLSTLPVGPPPVRPSATVATSSKTSISVVTTVPSSTPNSTETPSSSGVSAGVIVGIVIGTLSFILLLVVIVVVVVVLLVTQRSKAKQLFSNMFHQSHSTSIELDKEVTCQENETGSQKTGACTDDIENPVSGNCYTTSPVSHCNCKVTGKYRVLAAPSTKSVLIRCSSSGCVDPQEVGSIRNAYIFVPEGYSGQVCLLDDLDGTVPYAKGTSCDSLGIMTMSPKGLAGSSPSDCPNCTLKKKAQSTSLESKEEFCASLSVATSSHK